MKRCTLCGIEKDGSEFSKSARDGLRSWCKACSKVRAAEYYAENREWILASVAKYASANTKKISARSVAWKAANPERARRNARAHNLMRAIRKFGISKEEYEAKLAEQRRRCPICGKSYVFDADAGHPCLPCIEHSHAREARLGPRASLRGIVCSRCNFGRIGTADRYLRKLGILDTDPEALPALMGRNVTFAENVAKHVTGSWDPTSKEEDLGKSQRDKGKRGERALAEILREAFPEIGEEIRRGWQTRFGDDEPDIIAPGLGIW